jgi:D-alanyl-D-alanine carboxypeptidase
LQISLIRRPFLVATLVLGGFLGSFMSAPSAQAAKYSSIVIDAQTGQVVSEFNADNPNFPASLTKMMTLYLTFEALERHAISLEQRFPISSHASAQEPTKLDLVAGDSIAVHDLILGLVTQSANDAAVVLAEGIGGSESGFAERMTRTARGLGMNDTTFHNASGLPDPYQRTTARDLSVLARHLYLDYPRQYAYFSTESFTYRGVRYSNHNHLMSSFQGMDGIKTGFIRASGFNLAASAVRNHRRLIGVVMGGTSAHARDLKMADLLNAAFDGRSSPDGHSPEMRYAAATPAPVAAAPKVASNSVTPKLNFGSLVARGAVHTLATLSPIGHAEAATMPKKVASAERWAIQVGAYHEHTAATRAGTTARAQVAVTRGKPVVVVASKTPKGPVYSARITNLTQSQAQSACQKLRREHKECAVVPASTQVAELRGSSKTLID